MKAMIVDDERHVIDAVTMLVPWVSLGVDQLLTATSVPEAARLLQSERPEIAVVDIVIGDGLGLELIEHIVREGGSTKVVTISGHDDFEYVRQTLLGGSVDYLLKPLEKAPLVAAVEKAIAAYREEQEEQRQRDSLSKQVDRLSAERQRTLLQDMLSPGSSQECYTELLGVNPSLSDQGACVVLFIDLAFYRQASPAFSQDFSAAFYGIRKRLESTNWGTAMVRQRFPNEAVVVLHHNMDAALELVEQGMGQLREKYALHLGCGARHPLPQGISVGYEQARAAFYERDCSAGTVESAIRMGGSTAAANTIPLDKVLETQVFTAILAGDLMEIQRATQGWLAQFWGQGPTKLRHVWEAYRAFKELYGQWSSYFTQRYRHFTAPSQSAFPEPSVFFREQLTFDLSHMSECLCQLLTQLSQELHSRSRVDDISQRVADYIEVNYQLPFSQKECALRFHINKEYLCRKFKESLGVGMITYLNNVRIRHAMELLQMTNEKIADIALAVGYDNAKYFAKIFKEHSSLTPSEYRIRLFCEDATG